LQLELWHSVLRRRCSPNSVFGLKVFPQQLEALQRSNQPLLETVLATMLPKGGPRRVVYLRRRDRIAQTVSYARASLSGIWRKEQEKSDAALPQYSEAALESAERGIELQESVWARMFHHLDIHPLTLWHEDVISAPAAAADEVARYIGVTIDPGAGITVPTISKQAAGDAYEWVQMYRRRRAQEVFNPEARTREE
jgi:LPS sulfotransferase NodH